MSGSTVALRLAPDVAAAAGGDDRAFARLVDATRNTVASIAFAILRDPELARDVAQEVYVAAWRELPRLREATSFLPWIRQTTRNRAHHALRSRARRRRRVATVDPDTLLSAAADPRPDAMKRILEAEERDAVAAAIDGLPDGSREVVILYYREGESVRQVAELLDLSESAVKQRLARARDRLRDQLIRHVKDTAPRAAFTAGVMAALTAGAPAAAAAATLTAGKVSGQAGGAAGTAGVTITGGLLGGMVGLMGGGTGIVISGRKLMARARDDRERRGVWAFSLSNLSLTLAFLAVVLLRPEIGPVAIAFLGMFGGLMLTHLVLLPRITARRKAAEKVEDPAAFAARERKERRNAIAGFVLGFLLGGGSLLLVWLLG